ncbi:hypothetical protein Bca52824_092258 [Brassica carinata]|uniref:Uncharacterized protein n=1 Tax=Brassica carinata TaxID=52824 RepID=A0A8X7TDZ4_BRACI|nr:hypothetical protein Bca52824_092258 [Brassica carinata]
MSGKYYFTFLKKSIMILVKSNKNVSKEKLLEFGAMQLANKVALEEKLPMEEKEKLCETASTTFGFDWREFAHKLSYDKQGMNYYMMKSGMEFTEHILDKELEDFKKLDEEDKKQEIAKIRAEHKFHETIWRSRTIFFNMLIDGLMEKIPAETIADAITDNLWWSLACEVARVLVVNNKDLADIDTGDCDGIKFIHIIAEDDMFHELELHKNGIIYKYGKEETPLFKGYKEIISDFVEKKKKTNLE